MRRMNPQFLWYSLERLVRDERRKKEMKNKKWNENKAKQIAGESDFISIVLDAVCEFRIVHTHYLVFGRIYMYSIQFCRTSFFQLLQLWKMYIVDLCCCLFTVHVLEPTKRSPKTNISRNYSDSCIQKGYKNIEITKWHSIKLLGLK